MDTLHSLEAILWHDCDMTLILTQGSIEICSKSRLQRQAARKEEAHAKPHHCKSALRSPSVLMHKTIAALSISVGKGARRLFHINISRSIVRKYCRQKTFKRLFAEATPLQQSCGNTFSHVKMATNSSPGSSVQTLCWRCCVAILTRAYAFIYERIACKIP